MATFQEFSPCAILQKTPALVPPHSPAVQALRVDLQILQLAVQISFPDRLTTGGPAGVCVVLNRSLSRLRFFNHLDIVLVSTIVGDLDHDWWLATGGFSSRDTGRGGFSGASDSARRPTRCWRWDFSSIFSLIGHVNHLYSFLFRQAFALGLLGCTGCGALSARRPRIFGTVSLIARPP